VLSACSSSGDFGDGGANAVNGTTKAASTKLTIAQSADISTMDPAMHRARINQSVVREVFDALVNQSDDLKIVPELATSWESVDPTTWRFHLRQNVKFHNGEPFDANAVKFSLERVIDPAQKSPRASMLSMISSVTVEDPMTVVIKTKQPSSILLAELSVNEIVPPKYVKQVGDAEFAKKPVGTGPFKFVEWVPNERVVLAANDDYWGGRPKVDQLVFRPIPEVAARMAALQSGDVQIAAEIPPDLAKGLSGEVKAASASGTRIFFLAMNVTKAPFTDRKVRVAVNEAIDKEALVKGLYLGQARPLNQPAFPEMVGYDSSYQGYAYDQAKAKQVLSGVSTPVRLDVDAKDKTLAEAVAGQLQAAGLKTTVNVLESEAFTKSIESGDSTAYLSSWGVSEGDADVIFARHFWSPSRDGAFYTGYRNAAVDKLIEQSRTTTDNALRTDIYKKAIEQVMSDAPWAPILNPQETYGVSTRVTNWSPSPIGRFNVVKTSVS
jgi:peptide/nickel transport system substrate-binding protein